MSRDRRGEGTRLPNLALRWQSVWVWPHAPSNSKQFLTTLCNRVLVPHVGFPEPLEVGVKLESALLSDARPLRAKRAVADRGVQRPGQEREIAEAVYQPRAAHEALVNRTVSATGVGWIGPFLQRSRLRQYMLHRQPLV